MKTDDLIALLANRVEPVDPKAVQKRFQWALLVGMAGGFVLMLGMFGLRQDLGSAAMLPMFWLKLAVPLAMALPALVLTARLGRPGVPPGRIGLALPLPWLALMVLALVVLTNAEPQDRLSLVLGSTWLSCAFNITLVSLPSFTGVLWALRGLAPTNPALAGACAGLLAACLGSVVYALHCTEMQAPFLAVWYLMGLSIPTAAGAMLGPRLLRW